jgi:23S rRNA (guanosine2251-2'-O)-methyltransferase
MKNPQQKNKLKQTGNSNNQFYIYGKHAVLAAITNSNRIIHKIFITSDEYNKIIPKSISISKISKQELIKILPPSSVHQNIAALVTPLKQLDINDIISKEENKLIIILDNVTDPHNIGAILRSAAAFSASCLIMTDINSPQESGTIAKNASGALEITPIIKISNLATTIKQLQNHNYWVIGLDGEANMHLEQTPTYDKIAIILGAEGKGLRQLTRKLCDLTVKLNISPNMESLNVSNAAAIALYHFSKIN